MAFVDELKIHIKAGRGGDGVVRWRHEKDKEYAGPSGGNGGRGGDVYVVGSRDLGILARYRNTKEFKAKNGSPGDENTKQGASGDDLYIDVPVGSLITNLETGWKIEVIENGESKLILHGGRGGLGNEHFKSSRNTTPKEFTLGESGEESDFLIELQLIADFGLVGLPNAGKSSLLNSLTNAKAKIGSYPFTTLEPNLGEIAGLVIADIPGLIEGSSSGKGLGYKFLRHIRRTKILLHLISLESSDLEADYKLIKKELGTYEEELLGKPEIIVLTKLDLVDDKTLKEKVEVFKNKDLKVLSVSILDDVSIKSFSDALVKIYTLV